MDTNLNPLLLLLIVLMTTLLSMNLEREETLRVA